MTKYDTRSADAVLLFVGDEPAGSYPATDLSGNALARLTWLGLGSKRPATPDDVTDKDIDALVTELVATGKYKPAKPGKGDKE